MSVNDRSLNQTNVSRSLNRSKSRTSSLRQNCSDWEVPITTKTVVVSGRTTSMLSIIDGRSSSRATLVSLRMALGSFMKRASAAWMIGVVENSCSPYFCTNSADVPAIDTTRSNRGTAVVVART